MVARATTPSGGALLVLTWDVTMPGLAIRIIASEAVNLAVLLKGGLLAAREWELGGFVLRE